MPLQREILLLLLNNELQMCGRKRNSQKFEVLWTDCAQSSVADTEESRHHQWGLRALRHGVQISMEAILTCHPLGGSGIKKKGGVATTHRCILRCLTQLGFEASKTPRMR